MECWSNGVLEKRKPNTDLLQPWAEAIEILRYIELTSDRPSLPETVTGKADYL